MFPKTNLVGGLEHEFDFSIYWPVIIPTDELIFFRGVGIPLTSNPMTFMTGLDSLRRLVWEEGVPKNNPPILAGTSLYLILDVYVHNKSS